jgi:hypothetical protein
MTLLLEYHTDTLRKDIVGGPYEFVVPPEPRYPWPASWHRARVERLRKRAIDARHYLRACQRQYWATPEEAARIVKAEQARLTPKPPPPRKKPHSMSAKAAHAYGYVAA